MGSGRSLTRVAMTERRGDSSFLMINASSSVNNPTFSAGLNNDFGSWIIRLAGTSSVLMNGILLFSRRIACERSFVKPNAKERCQAQGSRHRGDGQARNDRYRVPRGQIMSMMGQSVPGTGRVSCPQIPGGGGLSMGKGVALCAQALGGLAQGGKQLRRRHALPLST